LNNSGINTFVVMLRKSFVKSIYLEPIGDTIPESSKFNNCSVVLGITFGETGGDAIHEIATKYELPVAALYAHELAQ
jgi:hypothetical protein